MRTTLIRSLFVALALSIPAASEAAPLTGGTGPGGFELVNGATPLELWLDATAGNTLFQDAGVTPALNGDPVYRWSDRSGNGNHADATNLTDRRPAYNTTALSSNPALRFDPTAVADAMNITGLNLTPSPYTAIILDQYYGGTQGRTMQANTQNWLIGKWGGSNAFHVNGAWVSSPGGLNTAGVNNPTIGSGTVTGVVGGASYFINGVDRTDPGTGDDPTGAPGTLALGAAGMFPGEVSNSDISEIIVYSRAINTAERQIVENYLSAKYNVGTTTVAVVNRTLGANDLYAGDLASNGNFDFDVFGVGQASAGNSLTSAGSNGLGIEVTGLVDGQFVLAGHASGPNGITTNDMPGAPRWERSWFIDTTGVTTADLAFDWNDDGNTAAFDPLFSGLYFRSANSGLFTLIATGTVDTLNQRVDFLGVALDANDGYYTLGVIPIPEPSTLSLLGIGALGLVIKQRRRRMSA